MNVDTIVYGYVQGASLAADVAWLDTAEPLPVVISVHGVAGTTEHGATPAQSTSASGPGSVSSR